MRVQGEWGNEEKATRRGEQGRHRRRRDGSNPSYPPLPQRVPEERRLDETLRYNRKRGQLGGCGATTALAPARASGAELGNGAHTPAGGAQAVAQEVTGAPGGQCAQ